MGEYNPHLTPSLDGNIITDRLNGQFMTVSGVTPVTLAGNRSGTQGFFVAKPGFDARTATDSQLIFNSNQNVFKIVKSDTLPCTRPANAGTASQYSYQFNINSKAHGITTGVPAILAYVNVSGAYLPMPYTLLSSASTSSARWETFRAYVDATYVYFDISSIVFGSESIASTTFTMKYYLLQETAN